VISLVNLSRSFAHIGSP